MLRKRIPLLFLSILTLLALTTRKSTAQELRPPANIAGSWIIYAYNIDKPGSSLKTIEVTQNGNIISGTFRGPHQHGKFQGWISGHHIEFSTDTHDVLTFRGEITSDGISGLYGVHDRNAPWSAQRTSPQNP